MSSSTARSVLRAPALAFAIVLFTALLTAPGSSAAPTGVATVSAYASATYGDVLVVGNGALAGSPLYEFSGDVKGRFGCTTRVASGFDFGAIASVPLTCTGPESDFLRGVKSDDWPALTSTARPLAGAGVIGGLLGTVRRKGVGDQVTYAGHPLYLFDPPSRPFRPQGEGYIETVNPLAPWHGYWFLVSAATGTPAVGRATFQAVGLPKVGPVLALEMDANFSPIGVVVYTFSGDPRHVITCDDSCAASWIPVRTTIAPRLPSTMSLRNFGVIVRNDGTRQVTYKGKPLYLFAEEKVVLTQGVDIRISSSSDNGNGVAGPNGGRFSAVVLTHRG